jgi:hypothetical protein
MAITIWGVDPSITETQWASLFYVTTKIGTGWAEAVSDTGNQLAPTLPAASTRTVAINSGDAAACGVLVQNSSSVNVTLTANSSGNPRIDIVALRINWSGTNTTGGTLVAIAGTAAASPVAPTLTRTPGVTWEIPLARITIPSGTTQLTSTMLEDVRPGKRQTLRYDVMATADTTFAVSLNDTGKAVPGATIAIPDPGWPYRVCSSASGMWGNPNTPGYMVLEIQIDGTTVTRAKATHADMVTTRTHWSSVRTGTGITVSLWGTPKFTTAVSTTNGEFTGLEVTVVPA